MTGYYPCLQDEELVMSTTAASVSVYMDGSNLLRERERLLGSVGFSFGGIIPAHCRALQANVPSVVGLTDEAILDGSAYHIVAPVLLSNERTRLLEKIFDGFVRTPRDFFPGQSSPCLNYCVACAREDNELSNRQCWRVLANIPGNNTCAKHGLLLIRTKARSSHLSIPHHAERWIDLKSPSVKSRNGYDIQLSKDLQWLYRLKSQNCPGWKNLAAALTVVLSKRLEYQRSRHYLDVDAIVADLGKISDIARRIAPSLLHRVALARILYQRKRASAPVLSLLSQFAGIDLEGLFRLASEPGIGNTQYARFAADRIRFRGAKGPARLTAVKGRLKQFLLEHPGTSRTQLDKLCAEDTRYAMRHDPVWFAKEMPWPIKGFKSRQEWPFRDEYYLNRLRKEWPDHREPPRSSRLGAKTILRMAGLPAFLLINAQGRLPNTLRFINDLVRLPDGSLPYRSGKRRRDSLRCM